MEVGALLELMEHAASHVVEALRKDIVLATILNQHTEENNAQDLQKRVHLAIPRIVLVRNIKFDHKRHLCKSILVLKSSLTATSVVSLLKEAKSDHI